MRKRGRGGRGDEIRRSKSKREEEEEEEEARGEERDDRWQCVKRRKENSRGEREKTVSFTLSGVRSPVGPRSANTAVKPLVKEKLNLSRR